MSVINPQLTYWPIFRRLKQWKYYGNIGWFTVLGESGDNVLIITESRPEDDAHENLDDQVFVFGDNRYGLLGVGHLEPILKEPVKLEPLCNQNIQQISQGSGHIVALCSDGRLFVWGQNSNGQLGLGDRGKQLKPTQITTIDYHPGKVVQVCCGDVHTFAVTDCGRLLGCGSNWNGQMGLSYTRKDQLSLDSIDMVGIEIKLVRCGMRHTLALTTDGLRVLVWGGNHFGQLGIGNCIDRRFPVPMKLRLLGGKEDQRSKKLVPIVRCIDIAAGNNHSLILTNNGQLYGCGDNSKGQLGFRKIVYSNANANNDYRPDKDGTSLFPVKISVRPRSLRFKSIAAHGNLSVAMSLEDGYCWIWGESLSKPSGTSLTSSSKNPTIVTIVRSIQQTPLISIDQTIAAYSKPSNSLSLIRVFNNFEAESSQRSSKNNPSQIQQKLSKLFNNPVGSDLKFVINQCEPIYVHRWFLKIVSPYYRRMLSERWNVDLNNNTIIINNDFNEDNTTLTNSYKIYLENFRWLYTGLVDPKLDELQLIELIDLANSHLDLELKKHCEVMLVANQQRLLLLSMADYEKLYQIAECYELNYLRDKIDQFVLENIAI